MSPRLRPTRLLGETLWTQVKAGGKACSALRTPAIAEAVPLHAVTMLALQISDF